MRNVLFSSSIGTLLEWAEFSFYGYLAAQFAHLFFPMLAPGVGLTVAFGAFAVSYIARPLGSILFGHIGDKFGRKIAFSSSLLLMGAATLMIGLLPTYASIGTAAPLLLIFCRFIQGTAMAGEFTGAAVFVIEHHRTQSYQASSWIGASAAAGMLVGSLFGVIANLPFMPTWFWRVPFLLGFLGCIVGYYARRRLAETAQFTQLVASKTVATTPVKDVLRYCKKPLLQTGAIAAYIAIYIYINNIWWVSYVLEKGYFSALQATSLAAFAQGSVVVLTPLLGWVAQRQQTHQANRMMRIGLAATLTIAPLLFWLSPQRSIPIIVLLELGYAIALALVTAPMFSYLVDLFPTTLRYSGPAIGWNVAVALFGGTAPMVAQLLMSHQLMHVLIIYIVLAGVVTLWLNSDTEGKKQPVTGT